jgi:beta-lactamase superfamily II metal-dependent hydrolase
LQACAPSGGDGAGAGEAAKTSEPAKEQGLNVWFFACSQDADSILLQTEEATVMIDTGLEEDSDALIRKLRELGVERVDLLILTHPDKDHIGGALRLLEEFRILQVMQTACDKGSALQDQLDLRLEGETVTIPDKRTPLELDGLHLTIYPPVEGEYDNANNYSLAVLAEYEGCTFFFPGDAKKKRIRELLQEDLPKVDVYKAAHHGRDNGGSDDLIERLSPQIAVITAEDAEKETKEALEAAGSAVYTTRGQDIHITVVNGVLDVR